ncbi:exosome component 10 [Stomoxys calcitrans]|uniref:exosome component 10 n=1 Tax=Stomoxys calcitrans TaxID=35570 RepID=UPI0027E21886|nr:exosome component 10 [Stomoxys calcitrans]
MDSTAASTSDGQTKQKPKTTPIGGCDNIEEFTKKGLTEIMVATKCANAFPQGASRDLYCAYPTFGRVIDEQSHRILGLISHVLKRENVKGNIQKRQPDEQFEMLLECNDALFERLQTNLDELAGIKKPPQTIVVESRISASASSGKGAGSWNLKNNEASPTLAARLITAKNIARPQVKFQIPVDNSADKPFTPRIKEKPNSLKPLAILPEYDDAGNIVSYLHPYEFELLKFEVPNSLLKPRKPETPKDLDSTEFLYVDSKAKLMQALHELRKVPEMAIDVEHHSYRTFLGITCLVQISTRTKDYIFDALELREEMHVLNEVFTNPKIVKILHGADSDVEWLQRDLCLYLVNMFDTHQAAKALNFARLSLSYLLKHYCDKDIDKTFQLADWRIRPLPAELIAYARQDTRSLIYIYERLTNDLLDASNQKPQLLRSIYQCSTEICKKRYQKPLITADSHMDIYRKSKRLFDNRQLYALGEIFKWRDNMARQEDESYGYVLPNHMMLQISESLPREMQGILACCNPIPPLVRQHLHALHQIILKAREQPLVKPILPTEATNRVVNTNANDYNNKLHCPHDLTAAEEFRDDLPTLIRFDREQGLQISNELSHLPIAIVKPVLSVFDTPENSEEDEATYRRRQTEKKKLLLPYTRYMTVLPMIEQEKREEAARLEAENKKRQLCPEAPVMMPVKVEDKAAEEDMYSMPIKAMLKRKYEESVAKKTAANDEASHAKRIKCESDRHDSDNDSNTANDDNLKFVNLPPTKKELKQHKQKLKRPADTSAIVIDDDEDEEKPTVSRSQNQNNSGQKPHQSAVNKKFKNKNKKQKFNASNKSQQSSDKPIQTNYDYQKVDFKKFQGGAQKAKGTELKAQFHPKGNANKAQNKKFNKLFTFSNVKNNKK